MSVEAQPALDYSWLHDDLEEDLVGEEWHQSAIRALATSLKALAEARRWPWHVGDQVTLVAWKPDNGAWRPAPDLVIYPHLGPVAPRTRWALPQPDAGHRRPARWGSPAGHRSRWKACPLLV
jgi:hypothetical protein